MSDFPEYSHLVPPANRRQREQWFLQQEERIARKTRLMLSKVVLEATERFINSLSAAGDMSAFDGVATSWDSFVDDILLEDLQGMYLSGGMSVWVDGPTRRIAVASGQWVEVVNQSAADFARGAANRMRDVGQTTWNLIKDSVSKSIEEGWSTETLQTMLERNLLFSEYRAEMIARTETANAYNNGSWEGVQALGEFGPTHKYWIATFDARAREDHMDVGSQPAIPIDEPFIVGGEEMMFPHSPDASAENVVNCRCDFGKLWPGDVDPVSGMVIPESGESGSVPDESDLEE